MRERVTTSCSSQRADVARRFGTREEISRGWSEIADCSEKCICCASTWPRAESIPSLDAQHSPNKRYLFSIPCPALFLFRHPAGQWSPADQPRAEFLETSSNARLRGMIESRVRCYVCRSTWNSIRIATVSDTPNEQARRSPRTHTRRI